MTTASSDGTSELVTLNGLNALLATAAENSPDHVLVEDDEGPTTAAVFARRSFCLANELRTGGLNRGERVLIVAGAQTASLVAIVAALRAGLEPVLVAVGTQADELAEAAASAQAVALIGPSHYGDLDLGDTLLMAAARAETVRGILTHGPERVDGAADISFATLDTLAEPNAADEPALLEMPTIATFARVGDRRKLVSHRQVALFADALSLVEQARINPSKRIISVVTPASLAGLVGGPFAAFVGASRLVLHGPFDGKRLLNRCDNGQPAHLLAPAAAADALAPLVDGAGVVSLVLASHHADRDSFVLPDAVSCQGAVIDLYTFGEEAVLAQRRQQGQPEAPRRAVDLSVSEGLGARLNRARAEHRLHSYDAAR